MLNTLERVDGHYEVTGTAWATNYVWVPQEEEVERCLLKEVLCPWRASYVEWVKEERAHPEEQARIEMEVLDGPNEAPEGGLGT